MMGRWIAWNVAHRWSVCAVTLILCLWGAWSFQSLPIDAVPDITNQQVQINATSQGLSPEDLETKVTYPLEVAMGGIPGVQEVRSLTKFGLSQVTVVFDDDTDIYRDRQLVNERLQTVSHLPPGVDAVTLSPVTTGLGEIFHYQVEITDAKDPAAGLMAAREAQEWLIKPKLLTVPRVAEVNVIGGYARQLQVQPRITQMAKYRVSLGDLKDALEKTNRNAGGGYVREFANQVLVEADGQLRNLDQVRGVPIRSLQNLTTVHLGDIADARFAGATRTGAALVNGHEAVLGTVMMLSGSNSRTVAKAVAAKIAEITHNGELPPNLKITTLYDRSDLVGETLHTVIHNLLVGAALVVIVLFLLLGNLKAALSVSLSIPATLLVTFGFMRLFHISGNLMSLGALDFGIIVDGSVIVVDQCVRWIQDRNRKQPVIEKVVGASTEIRSAAGFGQIMVIVVFLPILGLAGIEGKMFRPMAETFSIALGVALLLSFTFVPALASILFSEDESDKEPWLMRQIQALYPPVLRWSLAHGKTVFATAVVLVGISGFAFWHLGAEFLPRLDEGSLVLQMVRKVEVSLESSVAMQAQSEEVIKQFGSVAGVFSRIGTAEVATDPMGPNESDTFVLLKPKEEWQQDGKKFRDKEAMVQSLIDQLNKKIPDQEVSATQPIQMRFNDMLEGTRADVTIKIFGEELKDLTKLGHQVAEVIKPIPGSGDVQTEFRGEVPLLRVEPNLAVLDRYSLSAGPVLDAIGMGMGGEQAGEYFEGQRKIPVVIKFADEVRNDFSSLQKIQVAAGDSLTVPLSQVATFRRDGVLSPILRENSKRRTAVLINPRGRDVASFVAEAQSKIADQIKLPPRTRIEWSGAFENLRAARVRIGILAPIALLAVALMIYGAFGSWLETAVVLLTVPLALVGGVFGLILSGIPFSISAAVGFIALSGIAVLNGVVLVHSYNDLRSATDVSPDWVVIGASSRLRAVLMTALVDIFGFVPMALSTGIGAEVQRPLAVVVIGGVITSTALTLIVLPAVCQRFIPARRT